MEFRQLKFFVEICRLGNFSKAADACFISSAGISLAISRLEDELQCKLFNRAKGISLTDNGTYLLPRAQKIVAEMEEMEDFFANQRKQAKRLKVAFSIGTLEEVGGKVLARFRKEHPQILVDMSETEDALCNAIVANGEAELGLTVGPFNATGLDATLMYSTHNALLVHSSHPLADRSAVSIADLKDVPLAVQRETTQSTANLMTLFRRAKISPQISTYVDDVLLLFYMPSIDQACSVCSVTLANKVKHYDIRAIPFEDELMSWNIYLIKQKGVQLSPQARYFEQLLLEYRDEAHLLDR